MFNVLELTFWLTNKAYTCICNCFRLLVDNSPIRVFNNMQSLGLHYPTNQPMRVYCSFWNADDWATQGGRVKADWSQGPKTASYRHPSINACLASQQGSCASSSTNSSWQNMGLSDAGRDRLRWVQGKFMIYNYCTDHKKFPHGLPRECLHSEFQDPNSIVPKSANSTIPNSDNSTASVKWMVF